MKDIILTIWITITIWTIIPNLLSLYKIYTKKVKRVSDLPFVYFLSIFLFLVVSVMMTGHLVFSFLNN